MARKKIMVSVKIKASTILEVIVSMAVIVLVFGIAMMIYGNVLRLSLSGKKVKAEAQLQDIMLKAENGDNSTSQTFSVDSMTVDMEVKAYSPGLSVILLSAFDANRNKVAELEKVIPHE